MRFRNTVLIIVFFAGLASAGGVAIASDRPFWPKDFSEPPVPPKSVYRPGSIFAAPSWPSFVRRVVVLPVACNLVDLPADYFSAYDSIWRSALQSSHRAEFVFLPRTELSRMMGKTSFSTSENLPAYFWEKLAVHTGAEAVAFLEFTQFSPYGTIEIGFRSRITEIQSRLTIWAVEDVVKFDEASVSQALRDGLNRKDSRSPVASEVSGVRLTPSRAVGYIASDIAQTLPPRIF
jgi:hypothetical protein